MIRLRALVLPAIWLACVAASEILGRRSPSDVWDAIGVFALATLLGVTVLRMRRAGARPPRWIGRGWRRLAARLRGWWPRTGVDLRGEPPLPQGFPPALTGVAVVAVGLAAAAFVARGWFPGSARAGLLAVSPTLFYIGLGAAWTGLLALLFASGFFAWLDLHDALWNAEVPSERRGWVEALTGVAWLSLVTVLVVLVPIWVCWALILFALAAGTGAGLAVNRYEPLRFLWRMKASRTQEVKVLSAGAAVAWNCLVAASLLVLVAVTAVGIGRAGRLADTMPLTIGLGSAASWAAAIGFALWVAIHLVRPARLVGRDPARPQPAVLRVGDRSELPHETRRRLRVHGFRCTSEPVGRDGSPGISIDLDETAPPGVRPELDSTGARVRLAPGALVQPPTLAELRRLDTGFRRASLMAGLRRLLKHAATRRYERGSGFWIAPHLWYVIGMTRDEDDGDFWTIGPPYHKVFPLPARQHLHQVFGGLEIDLVFAEDGVAFEDIAAVFARLFDVYDVLGPERIEEKDFVGLVRVAVMIHDLTLGEPLDREGYPEPSYEEIGRARILHIMKDRGDGDEEREPVPVTPEQEPVLAPAW